MLSNYSSSEKLGFIRLINTSHTRARARTHTQNKNSNCSAGRKIYCFNWNNMKWYFISTWTRAKSWRGIKISIRKVCKIELKVISARMNLVSKKIQQQTQKTTSAAKKEKKKRKPYPNETKRKTFPFKEKMWSFVSDQSKIGKRRRALQ